MKKVLASATALIMTLTGCAGSDYKNNINSDKSVKIRAMAKTNNLKGYNCQEYTQTGSHLKRTVCSNPKQEKTAEEASRGLREEMRRTATLCIKDDGCKGS